MRMLMTPLMRRFTAILARKGKAPDWQFGAMPGSTAAAPVFLAQHRLQRGQEENHILAFDVSHGSPGIAHQALPHPQLRVSGAHRHCARPDAEHSAPQGPATGQCGELCALPPPLRTSPAEPCLVQA